MHHNIYILCKHDIMSATILTYLISLINVETKV